MARVSFEIEAGLGAVAIHRGDQQFAGTALDHADGELDGVEAGGVAAAMGEDFPFVAIVLAGGPRLALAGIDRDDDALVAELVGGAGDEIGIVDGGGVDRHLVGAGQQQLADILDLADTAADGHRHEAVLGGAGDDVEDGVAALGLAVMSRKVSSSAPAAS